MIHDFLFNYSELKVVVQLLDIRHKPSQDDIAFRNMLIGGNIPHLVIANKTDKVKNNQLRKSNALIVNALDLQSPPMPHSALKNTGKSQILRAIQSFL